MNTLGFVVQVTGQVLLIGVLLVSLTWMLYTSTINVLRARKELPWYALAVAAPWILLAVSVNVIFLQAVIGSALFLDPPRWHRGEWFLTQRLRRYRQQEPKSWRGRIAQWICVNWLNPTDTLKDHC